MVFKDRIDKRILSLADKELIPVMGRTCRPQRESEQRLWIGKRRHKNAQNSCGNKFKFTNDERKAN